LGLLKTEFRNVNGKLKLQFIARRGEKAEQWIEKLKVDIPIRFNIPVIVGGLPMVFQVGFDLIVQPALTTKNDTFDASYEIPFSGNGNVLLDGNKFSVGGTLAADRMDHLAHAERIPPGSRRRADSGFATGALS